MSKLYTYYRSTAAYRVRIALNYKAIKHDLIPIDLVQEEHYSEFYRDLNKQSRIPTYEEGHLKIGQSAAILEYLEEKYPEPNLLPKDSEARGWVRYLSQIIISDMHPLNNSSVVQYLHDEFKFDHSQIMAWYHHWLKQGFDALEKNLADHPECKNFCWGNKPTFADICLIPQLYNAERFQFPTHNYPTLQRINHYCLALPYFEKAHPKNQEDYLNQSGTSVP